MIKNERFDFKDIVYLNDEAFCQKLNIPLEDLTKLKAERPQNEEKDESIRFY